MEKYMERDQLFCTMYQSRLNNVEGILLVAQNVEGTLLEPIGSILSLMLEGFQVIHYWGRVIPHNTNPLSQH